MKRGQRKNADERAPVLDPRIDLARVEPFLPQGGTTRHASADELRRAADLLEARLNMALVESAEPDPEPVTVSDPTPSPAPILVETAADRLAAAKARNAERWREARTRRETAQESTRRPAPPGTLAVLPHPPVRRWPGYILSDALR